MLKSQYHTKRIRKISGLNSRSFVCSMLGRKIIPNPILKMFYYLVEILIRSVYFLLKRIYTSKINMVTTEGGHAATLLFYL